MTAWKTPAVDVHHHYYPPVFAQGWSGSAAAAADYVLPLTKRWSPAWMIEQLDRAGVQTAILSNNDRSFTLDLPAAQRSRLARECNEYAMKMAQDYPGRVNLFTYLPMPDVDATLAEIAYGLDVLGAAGVHLMTSYGNMWPGDAAFAPVLEELDRRKVTVFCHPRAPLCCENLMPAIAPQLAGVIEYPFDTGRAVMSLLLSGSLARYPNIRWIFCHTGSVIVVLAERIKWSTPSIVPKEVASYAPHGFDHELQRLYWDTAYHVAKPAMMALLEYMPASQVLFGSDSPFCEAAVNREALHGLGLTESQLVAIERDNALSLWPNLFDAKATAANAGRF